MRWILGCSLLIVWWSASAQQPLPSETEFSEMCSADDYQVLKSILSQCSEADVQAWLATPTASGDYPLFTGTRNGHVNIVQLLLEHKADPNQTRNTDGTTPLYIACQNGHLDVVRLLLEKQANPGQALTCEGVTPLYIACQNGHLDVVRLLLEKQVNPDHALSSDNATPLFVASQKGHLEIVRLLLENRANPNLALRSDGASPLFVACQNGHLETARLLLEKQSKPDQVRTSDGATPLFKACEKGHLEVVRLLVNSQAKLEHVLKRDGITSLFVACQNGHSEVARLLLQNGANPNRVRGRDGASPLFVACQKGYHQVVRLLLSYSANPDVARQFDGCTPLHMSAWFGHTMVLLSLLEAGSVSPVDFGLSTPLHLAVHRENPVVVALLLLAGADPLSRTASGLTAHAQAGRWTKPLTPCQRAVTQLLRAQKRRQLHRYLCRTFLDRNIFGESVRLHESIRLGRSGLASISTRKLEQPRLDGSAPLHLAVMHRNRAAVVELVTRGVNLSPVNLRKETPLQLALQDEYEPIISVLGPMVITASEQTGVDCCESNLARSTDGELLSKLSVFSLQDWTANALRNWLSVHEIQALFKQGILPAKLSVVVLGRWCRGAR